MAKKVSLNAPVIKVKAGQKKKPKEKPKK